MNDLTDPRSDKFFDPTSLINGAYQGGPYGVSTPFNDNSHISQTLYAADFRGVLMDYAEMSFILAEAARRGFSVGGTAAQHYENGITASMSEWGFQVIILPHIWPKITLHSQLHLVLTMKKLPSSFGLQCITEALKDGPFTDYLIHQHYQMLVL